MPTGSGALRVRIDDAHAHAGQGMPDAAALCADLAKTRRAEIARVHGNDRRAFRGAVAFERTDAEAVFEGEREALRQFFGADHHISQAAEIFRRAAAHVGLQKSGRREQEGDAVVADQFADGAEIERAGMVHHADAQHRGKPQRDREAEGVEKGQDAEHGSLCGRT